MARTYERGRWSQLASKAEQIGEDLEDGWDGNVMPGYYSRGELVQE